MKNYFNLVLQSSIIGHFPCQVSTFPQVSTECLKSAHITSVHYIKFVDIYCTPVKNGIPEAIIGIKVLYTIVYSEEEASNNYNK